jgi:hypothetical protein
MNEQVVVAHLRGNVQAALSLRKAIDDALLLAAPRVRARQADALPAPAVLFAVRRTRPDA